MDFKKGRKEKKMRLEPSASERGRVRPAEKGAEVEGAGRRGRESVLSGGIIYGKDCAGETALLIRAPKRGLRGNNQGEGRWDSEVWGKEGERRKEGGKRKKEGKQASRRPRRRS